MIKASNYVVLEVHMQNGKALVDTMFTLGGKKKSSLSTLGKPKGLL